MDDVNKIKIFIKDLTNDSNAIEGETIYINGSMKSKQVEPTTTTTIESVSPKSNGESIHAINDDDQKEDQEEKENEDEEQEEEEEFDLDDIDELVAELSDNDHEQNEHNNDDDNNQQNVANFSDHLNDQNDSNTIDMDVNSNHTIDQIDVQIIDVDSSIETFPNENTSIQGLNENQTDEQLQSIIVDCDEIDYCKNESLPNNNNNNNNNNNDTISTIESNEKSTNFIEPLVDDVTVLNDDHNDKISAIDNDVIDTPATTTTTTTTTEEDVVLEPTLTIEVVVKSSPTKDDHSLNTNYVNDQNDTNVCISPSPSSSSSSSSPSSSIKLLMLDETIECERDQNCDAGFNDQDDHVICTYLGQANELAEARLAQRRQARAEAREIRMRELERQQKEQEQNADRVFDMQTSSSLDPIGRSRLTITGSGGHRASSMSSRRSSEDSLEEEGRSWRDIRQELKDVEERFRKAMIANAQLDNERASQSYQIQLLKDKLEEMEEQHSQLQREHKDKCRDHDALKRNNDKLSEELKLVQGQLNERDTLIKEQGMTIVCVENSDGTDAKRALVSVENAQLLDTVQGSLDVRLKKLTEEKQSLKNEVQQLHQQLLEAKSHRKMGSLNGPMEDGDYEDAQREANKLIADYKFRLQKAEQEIVSLQASLARSETQVLRYKSTADEAEKAEAELKIERRKLQRENREVTERLEELETANNHLVKRLDKLKNAKSALLKDL